MRTLQGWLLPVFMLPMAVYAQEATVKEVHDAPAVRGSIIANMLQELEPGISAVAWDFRPELGVGCVLYAKILVATVQ